MNAFYGMLITFLSLVLAAAVVHNVILRRRMRETIEASGRFLVDQLIELRQPLQGLVGIKDLFVPTEKTIEVADYLDIVDYCSRHLIRQFERIQYFTELNAGKISFDKSEFSLRKLVDDALAVAAEQSNVYDFRIVQEWEPHTPETVFGVESASRRILVELLDNAIRYGGNGKIHLRLGTDENGGINFAVQDHGPGLPDEEVKVLTGQSSQKRGGKMIGRERLGLPLIKKLTHELNGTCSVQTERGLGCSVRLTFPMSTVTERKAA